MNNRVYTLLATGDMGDGAIMAIKSWPSINAKVFREIKEIILDLEIRGKVEADEEDIEIIQDGFLLSDTLQEVNAWSCDEHLSFCVWSDNVDEFWIVSSQMNC